MHVSNIFANSGKILAPRMDNKQLDAVKTTLRQIQRMASEPEDDTSAETEQMDFTLAPGQASVTDKVRLRFWKVKTSFTTIVAVGSITVLLVIIAGTTLLETKQSTFENFAMRSPTSKPSVSLSASVEQRDELIELEAPNLASRSGKVGASIQTDAQSLLKSGRVVEARHALIHLTDKSPEIILMLARSYDPNYLRLIPNANAEADPAEAERWYRAWRDVASKHGLVLERQRFDRIIRSLQ